MPQRVVMEGAGPNTEVPSHFTRTPISLLDTNTDSNNKTVKGKVVRKGPLVSVPSDNFILKTVIQEEDSNASSQNPSINVVLFGALAKDFSKTVNQGDVVTVAGFTVGKSPTMHKDKLHPCNLLLSGDDACVYVSRVPLPLPKTPSADKRKSTTATEVSRATKTPKYSYTRLNELKAGSVVNVYGVVVFFKQPFKTRGTDLCSTLKITDQTNEKVGCQIFCEKLEDHPKIFQVGDIIRMHRVKVQFFNNCATLVNGFGFSVLAFDGSPGGSLDPRTSSRSFSLHPEDLRVLEELRVWASTQTFIPPVPTMPLSSANFTQSSYFDLTCQLLAKAPIDTTCTLLRVWDGTRCPHIMLKVMVEPNVTEGPTSFSKARENLIANILVYDNHVAVARQLKPGDFLRIYNLRAIPGSSKVPGLTSSQKEELHHLAFHLHGGTAYGRGIRVLPENSPDVLKLKSVMETFLQDEDEDDFSEINDSELLEIWGTPPEFPNSESVESSTERSCHHESRSVSLSELKRLDPDRVHHVRVKLKSYQPPRLHQALKLYCSKCTRIQEVPDDDVVSGLFSGGCLDSGPVSPPHWAVSGKVSVPGGPKRELSVLMSTQLLSEDRTRELLFITGSTLEETCRLASGYQNIIPVRSSGGQPALLDLTAPFLFRGTRRYYGCKRCSKAEFREPLCGDGVETLDEKIIAQALGVQLLQFVLLMKLQLQDNTNTLDVFLFRDAESFFGVSAEDVASNQEAQNRIHQTMSSLCPAESNTGDRPWMDLCLTSYRVENEGGRIQTFYQICNSKVTKPAATKLDATKPSAETPPNANPA